jgi:hypothetical protein
MIYFNFYIRNPFIKQEFDIIVSKHKQIFKYKVIDFTLYKDTESVIGIGFDIFFRRSHSGIFVWFGLLGRRIEIDFYDFRHRSD